MTDLETEETPHEHGHRTDAERLRAAYVVFGILLVVLYVAVAAMIVLLLSARANDQAGEIRGYKIRAESCRLQVLLGAGPKLSDSCREPAVTQFYDPNEQATTGASSAGQLRILALQCEGFRRDQIDHGRPVPDVCIAAPPPTTTTTTAPG